jgi:hypothetical protein
MNYAIVPNRAGCMQNHANRIGFLIFLRLANKEVIHQSIRVTRSMIGIAYFTSLVTGDLQLSGWLRTQAVSSKLTHRRTGNYTLLKVTVALNAGAGSQADILTELCFDLNAPDSPNCFVSLPMKRPNEAHYLLDIL